MVSHRLPRRPVPRRRDQRGAVLIIALIMLVLITVLSLTTIRTTTTDQKIAGNARDREKAFQAAEAAVLNCLSQVRGGTWAGLTPDPVPVGNVPHWEVSDNWLATSPNSQSMPLSTAAQADANLAEAPRCMVERLGSTGSFRVTGRAKGSSADSIVMLQATYSTE